MVKFFGLVSLVAAAKRPNVVLILTDDQDIELGGMTPMVQTKRAFEGGVSFAHFYVNTPICCPSRMQLLSGRYGHNIRRKRLDAFPPGAATCGDEAVESPKVGSCGCMRMDCGEAFEEDTYATALRRAGYATAYFGKYLNPPAMVRYCRNETLGPLEHGWPPGWDVFYGMCDQASTPQGAYYSVNWVDSEAGSITFTGTEPRDYTTSVVGNKTVAYLKERPSEKEPFFVAAAVRAPHAPQLPPPWYADAFPEAAVPRSGAYNASPAGKPYWMFRNGPLTGADAAAFDEVYADRWRCLLAVDDLVAAVFDELRASSLDEDTFVFYTSDHGFHFGHFRLPPLKMHKYEFDIRVPLLVAGPGLSPGSRREIAGFVDLAPTFLDIARASLSPSPPRDGKSLLPLLRGADADGWREELLVEYAPITNWLDRARVDDSPDNNFRALRLVSDGENRLYAETTSLSNYDFEDEGSFFVELYDLAADPHQLRNLANETDAGTLAALRARLAALWACSGASCP